AAATLFVLGLRCARAQGTADGLPKANAEGAPAWPSREVIMRSVLQLEAARDRALGTREIPDSLFQADKTRQKELSEAQDQPGAPRRTDHRKWEIEVHGGWMTGNSSNSGTGTLPAAGIVFPSGDPPVVQAGLTGTSRRVSSWYFGDGAALFNSTVGAITGTNITPLDPVLTSSATEWSGRM